MSRPAASPARARQADASGTWGHWLVLGLVLAALGAALLVQREIGPGPLPIGTAAYHPGEIPLSPSATRAAPGPAPASPVLAPRSGRPVAVALRPGTVSLVFEPGTGTNEMSRIVARLHKLGIPATFFVAGDRVAAQAGLLRAARAAGDGIGMIDYTGEPLEDMPSWRLDAELAGTQHALISTGDPGTSLVRPPGATTVRGLTAGTAIAARRLARRGYVTVLASRSAMTERTPDAVLRAVLPPLTPAPRAAPGPAGLASAGDKSAQTDAELAGPRAGLVIALCDSGPAGTAALRSLAHLAVRLRLQGYRFTTVTSATGLRSGPVAVSALRTLGQDVLLTAVRLSGLVTDIVSWSFLIAIALVASRVALLLVTGGWHRIRNRRPPEPWHVPVSVVIPAYNERAGIERCLRSMAASDYPFFEIIVVDDGSTDGTAEFAASLDLMVTVVTQPNAGKATALNTGLARAQCDVLIFADGDTVFDPSTISMLVAPLRDPMVGAVAGNVKVANRRSLLGLIQHSEYVLATSLDRRMYDVLDCMVTVPGAVGAFRRSALIEVGGVPADTLAEDTDLTVAIGRAGWRVRYAAGAVAWTEAPSTLHQLWSQRHRWAYGMLQVLWKYRSCVVAPHGKRALSWIGLPYLFAMGCVLPLVCPAADLYVLMEVWISPGHALTIWLGFLALQAALTVCAFGFDGERLRDLWTLPVQLVFYRQLMYLVMIHSLATALTGVRLRWHKLARMGVEVRRA